MTIAGLAMERMKAVLQNSNSKTTERTGNGYPGQSAAGRQSGRPAKQISQVRNQLCLENVKPPVCKTGVEFTKGGKYEF